jgi:hypothetical protein
VNAEVPEPRPNRIISLVPTGEDGLGPTLALDSNGALWRIWGMKDDGKGYLALTFVPVEMSFAPPKPKKEP